MHHVCIQTSDYAASLDFYTRLLGFEIVRESGGFHGRAWNAWLRQGSMMLELQTAKAGESLQPWSSRASGPVHLGFLVEDVEQTYRYFKQQGHATFKCKSGQELYTVEGEYLFKAIAPEGTEIEIRDSEIH
ncbi:MAG TPA: VOC family protein [Candidatus Obscuribacterales bacterium]